MPAKKRRSPQEKKRLSYSRDRRNSYGENDKGSRRTIPLRKRARHRAERRRESALLAVGVSPVDEEAEALLGERVTTRYGRGKLWRKSPDSRLGLTVALGLKRRADKGISAPETERLRIEKVLRNTSISGLDLGCNPTWVPVSPEPDSPAMFQTCRTKAMLRSSLQPAPAKDRRATRSH